LREEGRRIPLIAFWTGIIAGIVLGFFNNGGRNDW
jgi:hypothetical protein